MRTKQAGFSLLEVIVTIGIITILYATMFEGFAPAIQFHAEMQTESKLKSLRESFQTAYKDHMETIEAEVDQIMAFGTGDIEQKVPAANGRCTSESTTMAPIARYLSESSTRAHLDGYSQPVCIYITAQQSVVVDGVPLSYHSVAIVSPGNNNVVDTGTALSADGELTLGGDDLGVLLDGRAFVQGQFQITIDALRRTADAYQAYFQARYQADSDRAISIDYFSCGDSDCSLASDPHWDMDGAMPELGDTVDPSLGEAMDKVLADGSKPYEILGLSLTDVKDGYGSTLMVQNRGNLCRNPENANSSLQSPPYTAVLYTEVPGGTRVSQTVVGLF